MSEAAVAMKPHSLVQIKVNGPKHEPSPWQKRHGAFPKGTVLPETTVPHCPRRKMADFPAGWIPKSFYERNLEQNQMLASCCRHPENHDIEALKSHPEEGAPDIYIFHCQCGRKHRVFCVGADDVRPEWR